MFRISLGDRSLSIIAIRLLSVLPNKWLFLHSSRPLLSTLCSLLCGLCPAPSSPPVAATNVMPNCGYRLAAPTVAWATLLSHLIFSWQAPTPPLHYISLSLAACCLGFCYSCCQKSLWQRFCFCCSTFDLLIIIIIIGSSGSSRNGIVIMMIIWRQLEASPTLQFVLAKRTSNRCGDRF